MYFLRCVEKKSIIPFFLSFGISAKTLYNTDRMEEICGE